MGMGTLNYLAQIAAAHYHVVLLSPLTLMEALNWTKNVGLVISSLVQSMIPVSYSLRHGPGLKGYITQR